MVGLKRVLGLRRAFGPGAMTCVVLSAGACDLGEVTPSGMAGGPDQSAFAGSAGQSQSAFSGAGGSVASGGASIIDIALTAGAPGGPPVPPCVPATSTDPVFKAQVLISRLPAVREFFSWTTDEQAAALRTDRVLFSKSEQEGAGPGYAFTYLSQFASNAQDVQQRDEEGELARLLGNGDLFAKKRYAWSEPWATRMGWPGEEYGNNLLRIVLKPEAWLVVVDNGELSVFDLDNMPVTLADALAQPERIGAILFVKGASEGGPGCGTFSNGSNGYREFILGNLAMVEEWSMGTQQIRDRLQANIADLTRFFGQMRSCPVVTTAQDWNRTTVCSWYAPSAPDEISTYEQAVAIPSQNYLPVPAQIAAIIETLQGDLFEPNPLIVNPGSP